MHLVRPSREYLPSYVAALRRDWSPDNERLVYTARYVGGLVDRRSGD